MAFFKAISLWKLPSLKLRFVRGVHQTMNLSALSINSWQPRTEDSFLPDIPNNSFYLAMCIGIYIVIETFGNALLASIILIEKYGGDSKKRTLINQLTSQILIMVIVFNVTSFHFVTYRLTFGSPGKMYFQQSFIS